MEKLMRRYRHMMVDSGAMPYDVTTAQLLMQIKGDGDDEKMNIVARLVSLVPETYWRTRGM